MSSKLYVGNIPFSIQESDLEAEFGKFGAVKSVKIITDFESGRSKGFGFVEMTSGNEAQQCVENINGKEIAGRNLKVDIAQERQGGARNDGGGSRW